MFLQNLKHATPIRRYRIGNFIGTVLSHGDTPNKDTRYAHALVIYQLIGNSQTAKPALVISAERTEHDSVGEFSLVSSVADGDSTYHGSLQAWVDCDAFEVEALKLATQLFDIEEEPIALPANQASSSRA